MEVITNRLGDLNDRLGSDTDCLNWLGTGGRYQGQGIMQGSVASLNVVVVGRITTADGSSGVGFAAVANPMPGVDIAINAGGAFFNGGSVTSANGKTPKIQSNSQSGQLFILLHELAHINRTAGFAGGDMDPNVNANNNDQVWAHCNKTITGR